MQLGDLEKQVLQHLWKVQSASAKDVHKDFATHRTGSLNTIQSTLDRLYKKELLSRDKQGHAFQYFPKLERQEFIAQLIKSISNEFSANQEHSLLAAFSSFSTEFGATELDSLEEMINERRRVLAKIDDND